MEKTIKKIYWFIETKFMESSVTYIVYAVLAIILVSLLFYFNRLDFIPATDNDYKDLIAIKDDMVSDFNKIYSYDNYTIYPSDDKIVVVLENDRCEVKCYFNNDFSLDNYAKESLHIPLYFSIFMFIFFTIGCYLLLFFISIVFIAIFTTIVEKMYHL